MKRWWWMVAGLALIAGTARAQEENPYPITATFPNDPPFQWSAPSTPTITRAHQDRMANELEAVIAWLRANVVSGGVPAYNTIQDDSAPLTQRQILNFIGAGFATADNAGNTSTDVSLLITPPGAASLVGSSRLINTTSPLTGGGDLSADLTITFSAQTANTVLAGPSGGGAAVPGFRALVAADIPGLPFSKITSGTCTPAQGCLGFNLGTATKGSIIVANGAGTFALLAPGVDGLSLQTNSGTSTGLEWTTGTGGGHVIEEEGSAVTQRANLNFVGGALTASDTGTKTQVALAQSPTGSTSVVGTGRTIAVSLPLQGGGDLTADRTISFQNQLARTFLGGPVSGGAAAPIFRLLQATDLPLHSASLITSGLLPLARGGLGFDATVGLVKGALLGGLAPGSAAWFAPGSDLTVLTRNDAMASGLEWVTPASIGLSGITRFQVCTKVRNATGSSGRFPLTYFPYQVSIAEVACRCVCDPPQCGVTQCVPPVAQVQFKRQDHLGTLSLVGTGELTCSTSTAPVEYRSVVAADPDRILLKGEGMEGELGNNPGGLDLLDVCMVFDVA